MLAGLRTWLRTRRSRQAAVVRACETFRATRAVEPIGAHVLSHDPHRTIVRVMYMTDHIPPDRAWFAVSADEVREIPYDDVAHLEGPWR